MRLIDLIKWDFKFQVKYGIVFAALIITVVWLGIISLLPASFMHVVIPIAFLTDFAVMGFLLVSAMFFFDKGQMTLIAIITSPIKTSEYMLSKAISLCVLICLIALALVFGVSSIKGISVNYLFVVMASILSSSFFILLGFITATLYKDFTDMLMPMGILFTFLFIPMLVYVNTDVFDFLDYIVFLWPTYSMMKLMDAISGDISNMVFFLSTVYIVAFNFILLKIAIKSFNHNVIGREKDIDG